MNAITNILKITYSNFRNNGVLCDLAL